jgi:single-strand DNA-binding protein
MQKWIAMGRTTKDMEIRYSNDGNAVARFDFAVNRKIKREGEADADFFSCVAFGKIAETFEKLNIGKGTKLLIEGEVRNNNYTNKDGQKVYDVRIMVHDVEFAESKNSDSKTETKAESKDVTDFLNIPDGLVEELPFS